MLPDTRFLAQRSLKDLVNRGGEASITDVVSVYVDSVVCYLLGRLNSNISDTALWVGSSACIFEFFPSSARLQKKEDQVRKVLAAGGASPASESLDTAIMLSFLLQGRDPLIGGLCAFLADLAGASAVDRDAKLKDADGRSLFLAAAPVNYIGRIATRDTRIVELDIAKGDEVVIMLALASGSSDRGGLAFGAGAHLCAGQALSIEIAECWLEELRRIKRLIDWAELRPLKSSPAVFQQFEEITRNDASESH